MSYGIGPTLSQTSYLTPEIDFPQDNKIFREILSQRERITATILNIKENAQYEKRELLTGQQWFSAENNGAIKTNYTYRITCDLVAMNGGPIPIGVTTLTLSSSTMPPLIDFADALLPVHGFGAATTTTNFYFINDPLLFVRTNNMTTITQQIIITNNTGLPLTWAVWVFEYIKT